MIEFINENPAYLFALITGASALVSAFFAGVAKVILALRGEK